LSNTAKSEFVNPELFQHCLFLSLFVKDTGGAAGCFVGCFVGVDGMSLGLVSFVGFFVGVDGVQGLAGFPPPVGPGVVTAGVSSEL